jgi:peptidylprolyl isomerase
MAQVQKADRVRIHFVGRLADGTIIDSTYADPEAEACTAEDCCHEHGPLELTVGEGDFYVPVEEALIGMEVGEKKVVVILPDDAFGDYNPENVFAVERSELPEDIVPEVGLELEVTGDDDDIFMVTIVEVNDDEGHLDSNHPLAGEELTYEFEVVEIL